VRQRDPGRGGSTAQRDALLRMLNSLVQYRTLVSIVMVSLGRTTAGGGVNDVGVNEGAHILVAKAAQELTGGHYEQISDSNALPKLLADIGRRIAATHVRQTTQYLMTIERPAGASGPIKDLRLSIARKGVSYMVSADGVYRWVRRRIESQPQKSGSRPKAASAVMKRAPDGVRATA
jgi:hypothetical protein